MSWKITVVLKKLNGEIVKMKRSSQSSTGWICSRDLIENPQKWEDDFIKSWEEGKQEPARFFAPATSEGLVVIDLVEKVIWERNSYSKMNDIWGYAKFWNDPEESAYWFGQGRVRRVERIVLDDVFEYQCFEPFKNHAQAAKFKDEHRRDPELFIDLAPYKVIHFRETQQGYEAMRSRLRQAFDLTAEDESAWDKFLVKNSKKA